ncbi:PspC domain-containing protein [Corynebacterium alimapuense]|uniref:PspC domain-containing protein n=1 Tax=Corynebacterium alimapuense TaxID=1576874 RepID=A0A3M8K5P3_9CORY|nr:PspC domain-containing protein [Corynebacterium alimapuense]RNE48420.1 PspC domain-containing protein [Corynebacterium alimapuense]
MANPYNPDENISIPRQQRRLHRSTTDKYVAGVLGGIAETYEWNSTLVRLIFIASILLPGPQFIAYIIAWLIMPRS